MAGRGLHKLERVRDAINAVELPLIIADATIPRHLRICSAEPLISSVGPYQL
jgi:hypothetical protein